MAIRPIIGGSDCTIHYCIILSPPKTVVVFFWLSLCYTHVPGGFLLFKIRSRQGHSFSAILRSHLFQGSEPVLFLLADVYRKAPTAGS